MTTDKDGFPPIVPTTQPFTPVFLAARHSLKGPVASESTQSALSSAAVRRSSDGVKEGIIGGRVWSSSNSPPPEALHEGTSRSINMHTHAHRQPTATAPKLHALAIAERVLYT